MSRRPGESGQVAVLLVATMLGAALAAVLLGALARAGDERASTQRAADLAALAGVRAMRDAWPGLFEPALVGGRRNPRHLERAAYLARGRAAAEATAAANGARAVSVTAPDAGELAPARLRVVAIRAVHVRVGSRERTAVARATAEAELMPPAALPELDDPGTYGGPLAERQGKRMRPDVALAFDRMERAARRDGVALIITSAFRSDAEQARLFAAHPDPRWVAPPGRSLHRLGTELDLGPRAAWRWLAAHAPAFGFVQRYAWEPWHWGLTRSPGSASLGFTTRGRGEGRSAVPTFVPAALAGPVARAASRWNVSAALIAAQLLAESGFNPFARSPAGALGVAQFMPATARAYGLRDPFDPVAAIDAQGHLLHDLLGRFGSVPLALAAYNAGPARVAACGCVPPIAETRGYVARVLGLLGGAGEAAALGGLEVRLVR
jgi:Transglycosylase SLT domain/D-alanyl-D-alanine carboxypeptidase